MIGIATAMLSAVALGFFIVRGLNRSLNQIAGTLGAGSTRFRHLSPGGRLKSVACTRCVRASCGVGGNRLALEQISSMTRKNAETAQQAASLSEHTKSEADRSNTAMGKMSTAINDIEKSASETAKIIKVIDEIAFQTNLLALNAAVEAARAGEAGKGFAVVAEEVRNLAMRSSEAAKNTSSMIEESVNNAKHGVTISAEVATSLAEITESAGKMNSLIQEIAAANREQSQGVGQVNTSVGQMDKVTQFTAAALRRAHRPLSNSPPRLSRWLKWSINWLRWLAVFRNAKRAQLNAMSTRKVFKPATAAGKSGRKATQQIPV